MRPSAMTLFAVILFAGSCASPISGPADAVRAGGTAVIAWQEPDTLNPLYSTGSQTSTLISSLAVEGLVRTGPSGEPMAVLAREVPTLANGGVRMGSDGMDVRYDLRAAVRWSDGSPFTSADVAYTWSVVMQDPKVASREGYDVIDRIDRPDELTAIVHYRAVYPAYLTRFDAILPQHLLAGADEATRTAYGRTPLGTGPFRIMEFRSGDQVIAERNPMYRFPPKPLLDRVIVRFTPSIDVAKAQLRAGEVQAAPSLGEADVADLTAGGVTVETSSSPMVEALAFNLAAPGNPADPQRPHSVLGDLAVRRALLLATPKQRIVDRLLGGRPNAGTSEMPLGVFAAADLRQDAYDPGAARGALDAAGWMPGPDGIRSRAGVRASLTVTSTTGNRVREQVEQVLVDEWKAIGVELRIRNVPAAVLTGTWGSGGIRKRGDFDIVLAQLGLTSPDPQSYLAQRHRCDAVPTTANGGSGANYERFCDPAVDGALSRAGALLDTAARRAAYGDVLRITNAAILDIWLYDRARINAYASVLGGHEPNPWDVATWNVQDWSLAR
ncbi:MAG: peptide ABC transporter substrate-binding protein [Chloroflexota bacterium]|nr:peptide ABC transporter substrate-binding protein [Chloroflexota bacterium]